MPRLFIAYDGRIGPMVQLALRAQTAAGDWGPEHRIDTVVDSGATRASLRAADAQAMGLSDSQRVNGPEITFADDHRAPSEELTVPVFAKVVDPSTGRYWGPTLRLNPTIKPAGDRLVGTSDFFEAFEVAFWPDPAGSRFSLVY